MCFDETPGVSPLRGKDVEETVGEVDDGKVEEVVEEETVEGGEAVVEVDDTLEEVEEVEEELNESNWGGERGSAFPS